MLDPEFVRRKCQLYLQLCSYRTGCQLGNVFRSEWIWVKMLIGKIDYNHFHYTVTPAHSNVLD